MNTKEGNKLIAEFLDLKLHEDEDFKPDIAYTITYKLPNGERYWGSSGNNLKNYEYVYELKVANIHTNWALLIAAVELIESLDDSKDHCLWLEDETKRFNFAGYSVNIETNTCTIDLNFELDPSICIVHTRADTKIEAVWQAVVKFIQRRNENTSSLQS